MSIICLMILKNSTMIIIFYYFNYPISRNKIQGTHEADIIDVAKQYMSSNNIKQLGGSLFEKY